MRRRRPQMSSEDMRWRAESDANALARAQEIKADPQRYQAAQEMARSEAIERVESAQAMVNVANGTEGAQTLNVKPTVSLPNPATISKLSM